MKEELITKAYEIAKERYAAVGVDVDKAMDTLQNISLSLHCWQADDVAGFESNGSLTGGIQATGNYPGKARNIDEVRQDVLKAASYLPGTHRLMPPLRHGACPISIGAAMKRSWTSAAAAEPISIA